MKFTPLEERWTRGRRDHPQNLSNFTRVALLEIKIWKPPPTKDEDEGLGSNSN